MIVAVAIMFGIVVGIGIMRQIVENSLKTPTTQATSIILPVSQNLLTNKMVTQWRGSFTGTLVSKTDTTYQIRDDAGNVLNLTSITPSGDKWNVVFVYESDEAHRILNLDEVPVNVKVRGEFWVFPEGSDKPVAGMFTILK
jgi:hypothetical protein